MAPLSRATVQLLLGYLSTQSLPASNKLPTPDVNINDRNSVGRPSLSVVSWGRK